MKAELSPVKQWAQSSPSLYALHTPEQSYTWLELAEKVTRLAASLGQQGVSAGDVVTCIGKNSPQLLLLYLACLEQRAICALAMPQSEAEINTKLATLYSNPDHAYLWSVDETELPEIGCHVQLAEPELDNWCSEYQDEALASIVFTSGSTGTPKAVAHTSQQHLASAQGLLEQFRFQQGDTWLLSLPMYHVSGLAIVYRWLATGATLKIGTGALSEDIGDVSHASLVATQLKRLLDSGEPLTLSHVLLGGSHVPLELSQQAAEYGIETWLGYGMTEAASTVTAKQIDGLYSAGRVLPRRRVKLDGQRIFIGGDTLASGYYQQGVVTPIVENGWFDSKDLGQWLGDELKIIGRADNQFISGGENIHCEEIEAVLNQLDVVQQAIVVPIKDAEYGHRPVAVLQCETLPEQSEIESLLKHKLTKFKWPKAYYQMPLELLAGGIKVSRQKVRQWLEQQISR